jgi:hypothetical protein
MVPLKQVPAKHYLQAFTLFLVIMSLAFSTRWVAGKKMLFEVLWDPSTIQLIYPGDRLEAEALQKGRLAFWNPYRGFGDILLIPSASQLGHPLKLLSLLRGTDNAMEGFLLLRLVLAALFTYMLARAVGLSHPASLLAGNGFMFCGYFREFVNFHDLSVAMFYPLALLFLLRFFKQRKFLDFVLSVWSGYYLCSGGHPESDYYLGGLTFSVALYSWLENSLLKREAVFSGLLKSLFLACLFIVSWHLINYLPFPTIEMLAEGWSYHPPAMGKIHFDLNHMIALFTPIFDLWLAQPKMTGSNLTQFTVIPSYLGFALGSLALLAVINLRNSNRMICFFLVLSLFLLGIFFAVPGFNFITHLPVVDRLQNFRYPQPLLALAAAVMAGFGFDQLGEQQNRKIYLALLSALGLWLGYHFIVFRHFLVQSPIFFAAALLLLIFVAAILFCYFTERVKFLFKLELKSLVFAGCAMELFCYFVFASPFYGPEAFKIGRPAFLNSAQVEPEFYRFYSPDQKILAPDTASLYQIRDLRDRAPMYLKDYYQFIAAVNQWNSEPEAIEEFLKDGKFYLPLVLDRIPEQTQDLLFGYLALDERIDARSLMEKLAPGAITAPRPGYFARNFFELGQKTREGFLIHPPASVLANEKIEAPEIDFEIGFQAKPGSKSDGADFLITKQDDSGVRLLFARFLAYSTSIETGWIGGKIKLPAPSLIRMTSLPGPKGDPTQDFALFADFRHRAGPSLPGRYQMISDAGPILYKRVSAAPRFFFTRNVTWVETRKKALDLIKQGGISKELTILTGKDPGLGSEDKTNLERPARISLARDETDRTELELELPAAGWIVMRDSYYPGWRAFIDGKEARVFRADFMFRAVRVPTGKHWLKFVYHPVSLEMGIFFNLVWYLTGTAAILIALLGRRSPSYIGWINDKQCRTNS